MKTNRLILKFTLIIFTALASSYSMAEALLECDGKGRFFSFDIEVPSNAEVNQLVHFRANINSHRGQQFTIWDFGDSNGNDFRFVNHRYQQAGTYKVVATVSDEFGSACREAYITISSIGSAPVSVIDAPTEVLVNKEFSFSGDNSSDPDGDIDSYKWTFGDGSTSTVVNPQHTYAQTGSYSVTLTVTDRKGHSDSTTKTIRVEREVNISISKALAITDKVILDDQFSLSRVIDKINPDARHSDFLSQLWSFYSELGCESAYKHNEFDCVRNESKIPELAKVDGTEGQLGFIPVGIFNRLDLADSSGAHCGEYRIIYALNGVSKPHQAFIIFEAQLVNPNLSMGLKGCTPIASFLNDLSHTDDAVARKAMLSEFYFNGLTNVQGYNDFSPVLSAENYIAGAGQVRTNSEFEEQNWQLREFNLEKCHSHSEQYCFVSRSVKDSPFDGLFADSGFELTEFQSHLLTQVDNLSKPNMNEFFVSLDDKYNSGAIDSEGDFGDYSAKAGASLLNAIQQKIDGQVPSGIDRFDGVESRCNNGSNEGLCAKHIIRRMEVLSCGGCHDRSDNTEIGLGQIWPPGVEFSHVSRRTRNCAHDSSSQCFITSNALDDLFLPHRHSAVESILNLRYTPQTGVSLTEAKKQLDSVRNEH